MPSISKSKILLYSFFVFIISTGIASFLPESIMKKDLLWFGLAIIFFMSIFAFRKNKFAYIFILVFILAFLRYSLSIPLIDETYIQYYNGQDKDFEALISGDVEMREKNQKFVVDVSGYKGKILVTTEKYPKYNYGDLLKLQCKLEQPEEFDSFAYDRYLAKSQIYSLCYNPKVEVLANNSRSTFLYYIFKFKNSLRTVLGSSLTGEQAGLAKAIVLGDKYALSEEQREIFSRAGISHMVAISGMHIGIIFLIISFILYELGLWRRQIFYVALLILFVYVLLIGAPASAMRALVMIFFILLANQLGRLNSIDKSLYYAAGFLLLINPRLLRDDIGFQLSFLAILAIIYLLPIVNERLEKYKMHHYLRWALNILITTTVIQVLTAPVLLYNFGQVSLIAPIVNLLVLWILPLLLVFIFLAILLSFLLPSLTQVFFFPVGVIIAYIELIAAFFSKI